MSVELREVKRRIGGVRQIHKATSAMEKIASARLGRDKAAVANSRRYSEELVRTLLEIRRGVPELTHPLMSESKKGDICVVLLGSDRGLCGGFNTALMDKLSGFHDQAGSKAIHLIVMGKVVNRRARHQGYVVDQFLHQPSLRGVSPADGGSGRSSLPDEISTIAKTVTSSFLNGVFSEVYILYSKFISGMRQDPVVEQLLPARFNQVAAPAGRPAMVAAIFEPSPSAIMDKVLPEYVRRWLHYAFLNSMVSETGARQTAMRRASDNAEEMINELMLTYSRLRQEDITTQMIEVAGGSMT